MPVFGEGPGESLDIGDPISGTVGSVLFIGTGPVLQEDNNNFFWDDSSDELRISGDYGGGGKFAIKLVNTTTAATGNDITLAWLLKTDGLEGVYGSIRVESTDASQFNRDGDMIFDLAQNGVTTEAMRIRGDDLSLRLIGGDLTLLVGDVVIDSDSKGVTFGEGQDATIQYDGTNLVINPAFVGTGSVFVDQNANGTALFIDTESTSGSALLISATAATTAKGINMVDGNSITTGDMLRIASTSTAITLAELSRLSYQGIGDSLANKTGNFSSIITTRTDSRTSGTTVDDFDVLNLKRTSNTTGAGGTMTSAGSVLRLENSVVQTAGTLTDTAIGLEIVMDANGTGNALNIDSNAAGANAIFVDAENDSTAAAVLITAADVALDVQNEVDAFTSTVMTWRGPNPSTAANNDEMRIDWRMKNNLGNFQTFGQLAFEANDITSTTKDGELEIDMHRANILTGICKFMGERMDFNPFKLGAPLHFVARGDNESNLFHVNYANDRIGIRTNVPGALMEINQGNITADTALFIDANDVDEIVIDIDAEQTTANVINLDATDLTTGDLIHGTITTSGIGNLESGELLNLAHVSSSFQAGTGVGKTGNISSISSDRTYVLVESAGDDDYDLLNLSRSSTINSAASTYDSDGSVLKIESSATQTSGALADDVVGIEMALGTRSASDVYAIKITNDNAGTGAPGGIDMSAFAVDEPLIKTVADAITTAGTVSHQIAIDIGGTIFYIVAHTHGS